jgi:hypothetical protein
MIFGNGKPTQIKIKLINNQDKIVGVDLEGED